jgi:sialidase-1
VRHKKAIVAVALTGLALVTTLTVLGVTRAGSAPGTALTDDAAHDPTARASAAPDESVRVGTAGDSAGDAGHEAQNRLAAADPAKNATPYHTVFPLFRSANMAGADRLATGVGYHSFRIPSVVRTSTGRLLAFVEGRRHNNRDYGDINLVYKRTKTGTDNGARPADWGPLQEVVGTGNGTWGNPTAVVDGGTVYLFMSWNAGDRSERGGDVLPDGTVTKRIDATNAGRRRLYLTTSTDDGASWSSARDMTGQLTPAGWAWDAVGPGIGVKLRGGELVVPAHGRNLVGLGSTGNRTWTYQLLNGAGSEGTVAQTPDGNLYRNDRPTGSGSARLVGRGTLARFAPLAADSRLPDPRCEGSLLVYNEDAPARTIFMNSASTTSRRHLRVRISYDAAARTFNAGRALSDAPVSGVGFEGGYTSMTKTGDFKVGALVETDFFNDGTGQGSYRAIVWRRFNLSWILNAPAA